MTSSLGHASNYEAVDYQIIGGGLIGLSTAYALARRGAAVRLIEARANVGLGTSFANACMVHASLADPWNGPGVWKQLLSSFIDASSPMKVRALSLPAMAGWGVNYLKHSKKERHRAATANNFALATYSVGLINAWREELSIEDGYERGGLLKVFRNAAKLDAARSVADQLSGLGFSVAYLGPDGIARREPALAPITSKLAGGIYYSEDYGADAFEFCQGLARGITQCGGEIVTGHPVTGLLKEREAVIGVNSPSGRLLAKTTIIAAGAKSTALLSTLGIKINMRPVKGYSLTYENLADGRSVFPSLPVIDEGLHAAITPLGHRLRIAGTAEFTGFSPALPPARLRPLQDMLKGVYPQLADGVDSQDGKPWAGFRPVSADGVPFIGKSPLDGLAINTGQGHMGWTFSAGSGELLAQILLGEEPPISTEPYNPLRS